jgi:hypothetical protein
MEEKEMKEFEELQDAACACDVYDRFHDVAGRRLKNLRNDNLKTLIKFIVPFEGCDDKKCPSKYFKNAATMIDRLNDCGLCSAMVQVH